MRELVSQNVYCPYCSERINVLIEPDDLGVEYIEDCQVCCRPIIFSISSDQDGDLTASVRSENE